MVPTMLKRDIGKYHKNHSTSPKFIPGKSAVPVSGKVFDEKELEKVPQEANLGLGCGNPTAFASLREGETVLDLGSGPGLDCFLAADKVGKTGRVIGVDMTPEMLAKARKNAETLGVKHVEFRLGEIECLPVRDDTIDVIISNCVINLSGDKRRVLAEAFRVLKPGGRLAVSDIVVKGDVPPAIRRNVELWIGCVAGALSEDDYRSKLERAGFTDISLEPTRVYTLEDAGDLLARAGVDPAGLAKEVDGKFRSAFIRARKPV